MKMTPKQREINALPYKERVRYFATGRVSVGTISQVFSSSITTWYVPKIRGIMLSGDGGVAKFDSPALAREYGEITLSRWKSLLVSFDE